MDHPQIEDFDFSGPTTCGERPLKVVHNIIIFSTKFIIINGKLIVFQSNVTNLPLRYLLSPRSFGSIIQGR